MGKLLQRVEDPLGEANASNIDISPITFSPNGKILAGGSSDQTIRLWNVETGKLLCTLVLSSVKII